MCLQVDGKCVEEEQSSSTESQNPPGVRVRPPSAAANGGFSRYSGHVWIGLPYYISILIFTLISLPLLLSPSPSLSLSLSAWACPDPDVCSLSELMPDSCEGWNAQEGLGEPQLTFCCLLRPHLYRALNNGIFMKRKYLPRKAVSQRPLKRRGR